MEARILTDDVACDRPLALAFAQHRFVNHSAGEYVSLKDATREAFINIVRKKHLHRYLAEAEFRYT